MHFSQKLQWVLLLQDCFNIQNVIPCSWQRYCFWQGSFWSLSKRKRKILHYAFGHTFLIWSCFVTLCHASPNIICTKDKTFGFYNSFPTFGGQKLKFTIHLSLFTVTIHCHYSPVTIHDTVSLRSLFKGSCPLYFKQVLVVLCSGLLS